MSFNAVFALISLICFNIQDFPVVPLPLLPAGSLISTATQAQASITITCPEVPGDYVRLYWLSPDARRQRNMTRLYHYDRWRGSTLVTEQSKRLQLAGPPYNAKTGSFSFLLIPELKHGGLYECAVFLNDHVYSQKTLLSVMKGTELGVQETEGRIWGRD